jgi:hypothetical protein
MREDEAMKRNGKTVAQWEDATAARRSHSRKNELI